MSPVFSWEKLKKYHLQWFIPIAIALILIAVYVLPIFYQNSNTAQSNKNPFSSENMIKLHGPALLVMNVLLFPLNSQQYSVTLNASSISDMLPSPAYCHRNNYIYG